MAEKLAPAQEPATHSRSCWCRAGQANRLSARKDTARPTSTPGCSLGEVLQHDWGDGACRVCHEHRAVVAAHLRVWVWARTHTGCVALPCCHPVCSTHTAVVHNCRVSTSLKHSLASTGHGRLLHSRCLRAGPGQELLCARQVCGALPAGRGRACQACICRVSLPQGTSVK